VEFRDKDHDGGEVVVTTIFSFRPLNPLNHKQVKEKQLATPVTFCEVRQRLADLSWTFAQNKKPRISTGAELVGSS
jgi:hypothetical protein